MIYNSNTLWLAWKDSCLRASGLGKLTMFGCPPIRLSLPGVCVRHQSHKEKPRQHTRAQHLKGKYTKELFLPPLTPNSNDIYRQLPKYRVSMGATT